MLSKILAISLNNRLMVLLSAAILSITGIYIARTMNVDVFPDLTATPLDIFEGISITDETFTPDIDKSFFLGSAVSKVLLDTTRGACFMINMNDVTTSTILNETFRVNLMTMELCRGEKLINPYNVQSISARYYQKFLS